MKIKSLKTNQLSKSELMSAKAGFFPDCEEGTFRQYVQGVGYQCVPLGFCEWVFLPDPPPPG